MKGFIFGITILPQAFAVLHMAGQCNYCFSPVNVIQGCCHKPVSFLLLQAFCSYNVYLNNPVLCVSLVMYFTGNVL